MIPLFQLGATLPFTGPLARDSNLNNASKFESKAKSEHSCHGRDLNAMQVREILTLLKNYQQRPRKVLWEHNYIIRHIYFEE